MVIKNNKRLSTEIVRRENTVLYLIEKISGRSLSNISKDLIPILKSAVTEIFFLDTELPKIVHHAVETAKPLGKKKAGFVNAVLRKISEDKSIDRFLPKKGSSKYYSLLYSFPEWIISEVKRSFSDWQKVLLELNKNAPFTLRVSPDVHDNIISELLKDNIQVKKGNLPYSIFIDNIKAVLKSNAWKNGYLYFQDEASQLVGMIAEKYIGLDMLDLCASPGGKCTYIAMKDKSFNITAADLEERLPLIHENLKRLGLKNINIISKDAIKKDYSMVLVDAPCSSLGTIRRHPEIKWEKKKSDLSNYFNKQSELLETAYEHTANNGIIIYSVCTFTKQETRDVCKAFLKRHKSIKRVETSIDIDENRLSLPKTIAPGFLNMDGFFISVFKKSRNS